MNSLDFHSRRGLALQVPAVLMGLAVALLASCGPAPTPVGISDPNEAKNRAFHEFNVDLDHTLVRPIAKGVDKAVPDPVSIGITNFAGNLNLPGTVVNDLLQIKLGKAVENTLRFALNTTIGIGGIFDPASKLGVPGKSTDFGETLHVWGMPEGNYIELPVLGPSTDRDMLGDLVDYAMNPLRVLVPPSKAYIGTLAKVAAKISDRGRYSATVDSILYESADGYAQARILYLEHRRYQLGQVPSDDSFEDPYANQ